MYGDVVMGVQKREGEDHEPFESTIEHLKDERYGPNGIYFYEWANDRLRLVKVIKVGSYPTTR